MYKMKNKIRYIGTLAGEKVYLIFIKDEMYILLGYNKRHSYFYIIKFDIYENILHEYQFINNLRIYLVKDGYLYARNYISNSPKLLNLNEKNMIIRKVRLIYIELCII